MKRATAPRGFGPWRAWPEGPACAPEVLAEILEGGQAFRWRRCGNGFEGRWGHFVVRLDAGRGSIRFAGPERQDPGTLRTALNRYFATDTDFTALAEGLPWRSDPVLAAAMEGLAGLRILRQPLGETLFCFLCSSTKQISQIKAICEQVAGALGAPLDDGSRALPDWNRLAEAGEARLRSARLGYRARYIHQTALQLAEAPGFLERIEQSPTDEARARLMELPGVGRKIADCVLLFGCGRLEAFPVDTWIFKIMARAYGLDGWTPAQIQTFARIHFGPAAGFAQQFLFAAARARRIGL